MNAKLCAQEVFDRVCEHALERQRYRSFDNARHIGRYRNNDGSRCFVGLFIPHAYYRPEIEGEQIGPLIRQYGDVALFGRSVSVRAQRLLRRLQVIHDVYPGGKWPAQLELLRAEWGLARAPAQLRAEVQDVHALEDGT